MFPTAMLAISWATADREGAEAARLEVAREGGEIGRIGTGQHDPCRRSVEPRAEDEGEAVRLAARLGRQRFSRDDLPDPLATRRAHPGSSSPWGACDPGLGPVSPLTRREV
jgi:hypothetical protein